MYPRLFSLQVWVRLWYDLACCTGGESCLISCLNMGIGSHNCNHSEDVAIFCVGHHASRANCSFISKFNYVLMHVYVSLSPGIIPPRLSAASICRDRTGTIYNIMHTKIFPKHNTYHSTLSVFMINKTPYSVIKHCESTEPESC